ncbi:hypothetical protein RHMOL_Rhmol13G0246300 [Rhododendron molle]|uniref:Uncharacterized protein n=1 Tax=Rhododendron molle TaxID=49168 RepID=A0ACC0LAA3_RHOML|nr:hypothetical protein RHMOL_Rhmol13G0246300 [Rhododendron molle]
MDSNGFGESQRLVDLVQQLRPSKPLCPPSNTNNHPKAESETSPIAKPSERTRPKRAAVLICLFEDENGHLRVILTKRASTLSTNSGDVSLPGGKTEEGDANDIETALREAKEEIGLDPSLVDVVTVLEPIVTKIGMAVVPVLGILADIRQFNPTPNAAEVESIFDAPLDMFLKDKNRREEEREWMGNKYLLHFFDYEAENGKYVIWALTAGILIAAASLVYQRPPDFQERKPQFWSRICL